MMKRFAIFFTLTVSLCLAAFAADKVNLRVGEHEDFLRLVFDWPEKLDYQIQQSGEQLQLVFSKPLTVDLKPLSRHKNYIKNAKLQSDQKTVIFDLSGDFKIADFVNEKSIVVDLKQAKAKSVKKESTQKKEEPVAAATKTTKPETAKTGKLITGGAVPLYITEKDDQVTLRFAWTRPVSASVFRRGDNVWIVFSHEGRFIPSNSSSRSNRKIIGEPSQVATEVGSALYFSALPGINPTVSRDGSSWVVEMKAQDLNPTVSIPIKNEPLSVISPRVFAKVGDTSETIVVSDPEVGDDLYVVPSEAVGRGVEIEREYIQFTLLRTLQGIAILPHADGLKVEKDNDGVAISHANKLLLSNPTDTQPQHAIKPKDRLFDFYSSDDLRHSNFVKARWKLENIVADERNVEYSKTRLDIAWFFFVRDYIEETLGVIEYITQEEPAFADNDRLKAIKGAALFLQEDYEGAWDLLKSSAFDARADIDLWRGALAAARGQYDLAMQKFKKAGKIPADYPLFIRLPIETLAARTALANKDYEGALRLLDDLIAAGQLQDVAEVYPLLGQVYVTTEAYDRALRAYEVAIKSGIPGIMEKGVLGATLVKLATNKIDKKQAIEDLDKIRFNWRGDSFEFSLMYNLGEIYIQDRQYAEGLRALKEAVTYNPDNPQAPAATELMTNVFKDLFMGGYADQLKPLQALALFDEFRELTPPGKEGDEMIRKLADRMVQVDLLDRAAQLLDNQVEFRLEGVEKARIAARLAVIYLLNNQPEAAAKVLEASDTVKDMPKPLKMERRRLLSRAYADQQEYQKGLVILGDDLSFDADLLRADMYWHLKQWINAAEVLQRLAGYAKLEEGLTDQHAQFVLNAAVALSLAGDLEGLEKVRVKYGSAMDSTPYRDAFRVVSRSDLQNTSDLAGLSNRFSEVDEFNSFMRSYREKLKSVGLSGMN